MPEFEIVLERKKCLGTIHFWFFFCCCCFSLITLLFLLLVFFNGLNNKMIFKLYFVFAILVKFADCSSFVVLFGGIGCELAGCSSSLRGLWLGFSAFQGPCLFLEWAKKMKMRSS